MNTGQNKMKSIKREIFELLCVGLLTIIIVLGLLYWLAPDELMPKVAQASIGRGDWEELTGKDAELEARITALESRTNCQQTGQTIDLSSVYQRISNLETESTNQKGLLDSIYQMLLKLFTLLTQVLSKLK